MIEQGSKEWFKQRYGNASASRIKDIIAKKKSGYSASRDNYMTELVLERFGIFNEPYSNRAMEWLLFIAPFHCPIAIWLVKYAKSFKY